MINQNIYSSNNVFIYIQGSNVVAVGYSNIQLKQYNVTWGMFFGDGKLPVNANELYIWQGAGGNLLADKAYIDGATKNGKIEVALGGNPMGWGVEPFDATTDENAEKFVSLCNSIVSTVGPSKLRGIDLDLEDKCVRSWIVDDWLRFAKAIESAKSSNPSIKFTATIPLSTWAGWASGYRTLKDSQILNDTAVFDVINIMVMDAATKHTPEWYRSYLSQTIDYFGLENSRSKDTIVPVFSWESNPTDSDFINTCKLYNQDGYNKLAFWAGGLDNNTVLQTLSLVAN